MNVILRTGGVVNFDEIKDSWLNIEVSDNGDLIIYRENKYATSVVDAFAAGIWATAHLDRKQ
jgi:hypothetical protein